MVVFIEDRPYTLHCERFFNGNLCLVVESESGWLRHHLCVNVEQELARNVVVAMPDGFTDAILTELEEAGVARITSRFKRFIADDEPADQLVLNMWEIDTDAI